MTGPLTAKIHGG